MTVKDIYTDIKTKIFVVTNQDDSNELNWAIEPTDLELIPDVDNQYFVKALQVFEKKITDCYVGISTPERIAEIVVTRNLFGKCRIESIYNLQQEIIPAVASNCSGIYELYYSKLNPQIGIDILKAGLGKASNKSVVAEDLGYILRDEGRVTEAIEAFAISEQFGPSSPFTYFELSGLYGLLGKNKEQLEYKQKYADSGGI